MILSYKIPFTTCFSLFLEVITFLCSSPRWGHAGRWSWWTVGRWGISWWSRPAQICSAAAVARWVHAPLPLPEPPRDYLAGSLARGSEQGRGKEAPGRGGFFSTNNFAFTFFISSVNLCRSWGFHCGKTTWLMKSRMVKLAAYEGSRIKGT